MQANGFIDRMAFGPFASDHPISQAWRAIRRMAINKTAPNLAIELQKIYDSEINVRIGWLWDGGIEVRLGDDMNGYLAEETVRMVAEIIPWLQAAIAHFYPGSSYALSLGSELRETRYTATLPAAEDRHPSDLPALWRATCGAARHG